MSSAALLGSRFPPPSVFRQVLESGWAMTVLAMGSEPSLGRACSPSLLRRDGVPHITPVHVGGGWAQGMARMW